MPVFQLSAAPTEDFDEPGASEARNSARHCHDAAFGVGATWLDYY